MKNTVPRRKKTSSPATASAGSLKDTTPGDVSAKAAGLSSTAAPGAGCPSEGSSTPTEEVTPILAQLARKALMFSAGGARDAAEELWNEVGHDPALAKAMLAFGDIPDDVLAAYEASEPDKLVRSPWGGMWLCAREPDERGIRDGTWVTLRAMRALGRGFLLMEKSFEADVRRAHAAPAAPLDLVENDFA